MRPLFALALTAACAWAEDPAWVVDDLDKALAKAGEEKKDVLTWWTADWLPRHMDLGKTLSSETVQAALAGKFVLARLEWTQANHDRFESLAGRLEISALPTIAFLDASGRAMARIEGFRKPADLLRDLHAAVDSVRDLRGLEAAAAQLPKSAALRLAVARRYHAAHATSEAVKSYRAALDADPSLADGWWDLAGLESRRGNLAGLREAAAGFAAADPSNTRLLLDDVLLLLATCEARSDFAAARATLAKIEERYPKGNALPDALLLLARIQALHDGAYDAAEATLRRLAANSPSSPAGTEGAALLARIPDLRVRHPKGQPGWGVAAAVAPEEASVSIGGGSGGDGHFGSRFGARKNLVARNGGSKETEAAVLDALLWLARHQHADGHWSAESLPGTCVGKTCKGGGLRGQDAAVTGLALLAFLGQGHIPGDTRAYEDPTGGSRVFGETVDRACRWLLRAQGPGGSFGSREAGRTLFPQAIVSQALSEAAAMSGDADLADAARLALQALLSSRAPGSGWGCGTVAVDTLDTGWSLLALRAARRAGFGVPAEALEGANAWLDSAVDPATGRAGYAARNDGKLQEAGKNDAWDDHETMTAAAMLGRLALDPAHPEARTGLALLLADVPAFSGKKVDALYWHFATLAAFQAVPVSDPAWRAWNGPLREALLKGQRREGCQLGSWDDDTDRWGFEGGRAAVTALNALTLEIYYR